jgi:hypothetical protein
MKATNPGRFSINKVKRTQHGFTYQTFTLSGWLNGARVRRQFKTRDEALAGC